MTYFRQGAVDSVYNVSHAAGDCFPGGEGRFRVVSSRKAVNQQGKESVLRTTEQRHSQTVRSNDLRTAKQKQVNRI